MWEKAGLVRTTGGLREGLGEIGTLEEEYGGTDLGLVLPVAQEIMREALTDCGSRGCHYRLDAEEEVTLAHLPG
jgi:aspartate oxidase